jgi:NADH-quinone oxidoreductase subunit G
MAVIYIDNHPYEVKDGQNLLSACLSLGFNIPYFCWHPAIHSVGACRQCAVKQFRDEKDTRGQIVMSCMTAATDGTRISIDDPDVTEFRAAVIEWLMIDHPHDCPVCDEGGECHLQDMTVMTGHNYRRYRYKKHTHRNQNLGPFINHEMNRCIKCYRCVRFYRDYAGGRDFNVFGIHNRLYFGRFADGTLENEFSGNLAEICPTGVFTDKTFKKHYSRKWDLQTAPSVCVHCGLGCNTSPAERYGVLRRIQNRYNRQVNGYFLCDRGRFGYEFVNSETRVRLPLRKGASGSLEPLSQHEALRDVADLLAASSRVIGIGSPRASLESNFMLRALVGPDNYFMGVSEQERDLISAVLGILRSGFAPSRSLLDAERSDAVLVLGEDVTNAAPRLALSLRQAVRCKPMSIADGLRIPHWYDRAVRQAIQDEKGPLMIASPSAGRLDDVASWTLRAAPDDIARLGFAIAHELDADAPPVPDLPREVRARALDAAHALKQANQPLVVSGTGCASGPVMEAAANVVRALRTQGRDAGISLIVPECNSIGAGLIGGQSLEVAFREVSAGSADTVIVLENDLYRRFSKGAVDAFSRGAGCVIVLDHHLNHYASAADMVLPAATFAEGDGTLVSAEGRGQRFYSVFSPEDPIRESWQWLRDVMIATGRSEAAQWEHLDAVVAACGREFDALRRITEIAPDAAFRFRKSKIPRESLRYSGRTAMRANVSVHEPKPPDDPDSALAFSMEGYQGIPPAALMSRFWAPGWNSIQALNKFQSEVGGSLLGGDPGIRLLEPPQDGKTEYFTGVPDAFIRRDGQWLMAPLFHIFGSEELSALGPAMRQQIPEPYVALNSQDSVAAGLPEGSHARVSAEDWEFVLKVKILDTLPPGVAGLPVGLAGLEGVSLPVWVTLSQTAAS